MYAYDCAQLQYTIQHRTVLIIFPLTSRLRVAFRGPTSKGRRGGEGRGREKEGEGGRKRKGGAGKEVRERKRVRPTHFSDVSAASEPR